MAYTISDPQAGFLPITATDAGVVPPNNVNTGSTTAIPTPPLYPGMIVKGVDPTYKGAEFILLLGVASTAVGSIVTYNATTFQTALAPVGTGLPQPVAVAMSANLATTWGWYQISGIAVAAKSISVSLVTGTAVGVKTIGVLNATATSVEIDGMLAASTATEATATIQVVLNRPHMTGRGTG